MSVSSSASPVAGPTRLDAFRTTGRSPTGASSPLTLHLLGPGAVGREVLRRLDAQRVRCVAVSDRSGTLFDSGGIDPARVADFKEAGGHLGDVLGAVPGRAQDALPVVAADITVDTTSTEPGRPTWAEALDHEVIARGGALVLAAKDALAALASRWLQPTLEARVGVHAALGGTGRLLQTELPELQGETVALALAGNATTTTVIEAVERGASLARGIDAAARAGLLEADPELDFRGFDAAVKLVAVAGAVFGHASDPSALPAADVRQLDPEQVRERAARGRTTRLVGRADVSGRLRVRFEEVPRLSPLAVPGDRVAYVYRRADGRRRLHVGRGLGALRTAETVLQDLDRIAGCWRPA